MYLLLILIVVTVFSMMCVAIVKTYRNIKAMPKSNTSSVMSDRHIYGVDNTGGTLDDREIYALSVVELGL